MRLKLFTDIGQAVRFAYGLSKSGDVILLSPACASFGLFKNYKERGSLFKQAVNQIKS